MIATPNELLAALAARGLADADAPPSDTPTAPTHQRPWYIGLLLGASGWLAGLFMLGFVAILFQPTSQPAAALTGAVLLGAAWGLFRVDRDGAFVAQLALALSIAGQCVMIFAINRNDAHLGGVAASALLLQAVLALVMPNAAQRALSAFFAVIAWVLTVRFALLGEPAFWRASPAFAPSLATVIAGWALAWAPVLGATWALIRFEPAWMARRWQVVLRPVLAGLVVGLGFATLASHPFESFHWFGSSPAAPTWLSLWPLLSALVALAGIAAAFALGDRALMGVCAVAALLHVSHFYYELGTSLLLKSLLMLVMGGSMWLASRRLAKGVRR